MDIKEVMHGDRYFPNGNGLSVTAALEKGEFKQLGGDLEDLRLFSVGAVNVESSIVKTGARNSHAKYFLFPACLRRTLEPNRYEMGKVYCGTFEQGGDLYVVFGVPAKGHKLLGFRNRDPEEEEGLARAG